MYPFLKKRASLFDGFVYCKWINNVSCVKSREKIAPVSDLRPAELIKRRFSRPVADIISSKKFHMENSLLYDAPPVLREIAEKVIFSL